MQLLKVIRNEDIGFKNKSVKYKVRKAARAVLFEKDKTALLFVSKHNYHKIPGGGIESDENIKIALSREIVEETGCTAEVKEEVGVIKEYRDDFGIEQFSYCFMAEVVKANNKQSFTKKEKDQGFKLVWVTLNEAIKLIKNDKPNNYEGKFIVERDIVFLEKVREMKKQTFPK